MKRPLDVDGGEVKTPVEKPKKRKLTDDEAEQLKRELNNAGREQDPEKAVRLFDQAMENDVVLNLKHLQVVLHLISGGEDWHLKLDSFLGPDSNLPEVVKDKNLCRRDKDIYLYMRKRGIELNEFVYTGLARIAVLCGDPEGALRIARDCTARAKSGKNPKITKPRLRTFTPALLGFCKKNNLDRAMEVESELRRLELALTEPEYREMLSAAVRTRNESCGTYILECMVREILKVEDPTAKVLEAYFRDYNERSGKKIGNGSGKYVVSRAKIAEDGKCSASGKYLTKLDLKEGEMMTLAEKISGLAIQRENRSDAFKMFKNYLKKYGPYDIIIDGANVGFFGQSKQGIFTFGQVETMVKEVRKRWPDRKALIVLHSRRIHSFTKGNRYNANMVERMNHSRELFSTPSGSNDDWYWIYAAVLSGPRGLIVTNDEMRDHIFQTLESKNFQRWKLCHQVRFSIYNDRVDFVMPGKYTTAIQRHQSSWWFPITKEKVVRKRHEKKEREVMNPGMVKKVELEREWLSCNFVEIEEGEVEPEPGM